MRTTGQEVQVTTNSTWPKGPTYWIEGVTKYISIPFTWNRCEVIRKATKYCCPMWFHELDAMEPNQITESQLELGWTHEERLAIMGYYYQHRGTHRFTEASS